MAKNKSQNKNNEIEEIRNEIKKLPNRKIEWKRFSVVFVITLAVFVIGIFFGNQATEMKFDTISNAEQTLRMELLGLDIQYSLIERDPCKVFNDTYLSKNLDELGSKVSFLENLHGANNEDVENTKKYYSLLQIRHFLLKSRAVKECSIPHDFILYFYSNEKYCENVCQDQGFVITNIRQNRNSVSAYSFDITLSNPALDTLKDQYGISQEDKAPILVINGIKYDGFKTKQFIEERLEAE